MGVPMLRPTPASLTVSSVNSMVPIPAWLDIFRFCSISDLGASLAVDKHWRTVADSYHVWADAYERTQRVDDSSSPNGEGPLRSLIQRPFGEDAIGWHVAVLSEENAPDGSEQEKYYTGHIVAYSAETDTYLVAYSGSEPVIAWEQERRKRTAAMRHNPSLAGKSRFSFLSPPAHMPQTAAMAAMAALVAALDARRHAMLQRAQSARAAVLGLDAPAGDQGCADGFHLVADEESCHVGAKFFKKPFAGSMDAGHEPAGCLLRKADNDVIFNLAESSKTGNRQRQQLCSDLWPAVLPPRRKVPPSQAPAGPQPGTRGSTAPSGRPIVSEIGNLTMAPRCGEGTVQIRHPNRCQMAATAYGKKYIGIMKSFLEPHGCLHRKFDQDMMFNRLQTNVTKKEWSDNDRELVCSSEADPEVPIKALLTPLEAQRMRIYCFGWTVRRPQEEPKRGMEGGFV
eukprot:s58_g10.t3